MADVAARAVLLLQADAPPGELAAELEVGADFEYVVHQASGMVAAQLGVTRRPGPRPLAGLRLRQRPPLADVARDVVGRTLRFDERAARRTPAP